MLIKHNIYIYIYIMFVCIAYFLNPCVIVMSTCIYIVEPTVFAFEKNKFNMKLTRLMVQCGLE